MRRHGSRRRRDGGDQFAEVSRERLALRGEEEPEVTGDEVADEVDRGSSTADGVIQEAGIEYDGEQPLPPAA